MDISHDGNSIGETVSVKQYRKRVSLTLTLGVSFGKFSMMSSEYSLLTACSFAHPSSSSLCLTDSESMPLARRFVSTLAYSSSSITVCCWGVADVYFAILNSRLRVRVRQALCATLSFIFRFAVSLWISTRRAARVDGGAASPLFGSLISSNLGKFDDLERGR